MIFKSDGERGDLNGFLDAGSHIQGDLHFEDTFRVDGKVSGKVISRGDLVVGERGEVEGEIQVGTIFVSGTVRGSVKAAKRVEITAQGRVYAELATPSLVIEDGAFFEGSCRMERGRPQAAVPERPVSERPVVRPMPLTKEG